jgi:hypothetical protein
MLRVSFSSTTTARAAVHVLEAYGYSAQQSGGDVVTDCPTLLALPLIQKRVGFAEIERLEFLAGASALDSTAELSVLPSAPRAEPRNQATA